MPIRIAQIVEATTGGVARHLIDLVTRLDPEEFSCFLYLSFERPESWREPLCALKDAGCTLREIPMARVPDRRAVSQLAGWARRDAVDILHLHSAKAGYLGRLAAEETGLPTIYTPHAFPFLRTTDAFRSMYRIIERRLAAQTEKIICVSEGERQEAVCAHLPEEKLVVIPNGIDFSRWTLPTRAQRRLARRMLGIADDEVVIGALARLAPQKGIDLLVQAAEDVLPDYPEARIIVWGDGPQRKMLKGLARRLRIPRLWFPGETKDPATVLAAIDVFCAPSRWEGAPYAVLEAMASGLPVVASDIVGHADLIDAGETGILFESDMPGALAGVLRIVLSDVDVRDALGTAARQCVEAYTVEQMVESTAAVYREVAQRDRLEVAGATDEAIG